MRQPPREPSAPHSPISTGTTAAGVQNPRLAPVPRRSKGPTTRRQPGDIQKATIPRAPCSPTPRLPKPTQPAPRVKHAESAAPRSRAPLETCQNACRRPDVRQPQNTKSTKPTTPRGTTTARAQEPPPSNHGAPESSRTRDSRRLRGRALSSLRHQAPPLAPLPPYTSTRTGSSSRTGC
jgi:hypothetical protein